MSPRCRSTWCYYFRFDHTLFLFFVFGWVVNTYKATAENAKPFHLSWAFWIITRIVIFSLVGCQLFPSDAYVFMCKHFICIERCVKIVTPLYWNLWMPTFGVLRKSWNRSILRNHWYFIVATCNKFNSKMSFWLVQGIPRSSSPGMFLIWILPFHSQWHAYPFLMLLTLGFFLKSC